MKIIIYIILYFILGIGYYLLFSLVGVILGYSYSEAIHSEVWFIWYVILMHWWLCIYSLAEYYNKHIEPLEL